MSRTSVSSSNLRSVGYDAWAGYLEVEFHGGRVYGHYDVPASVYRGLINALSKGSFYYHNLRNRYGCHQVY